VCDPRIHDKEWNSWIRVRTDVLEFVPAIVDYEGVVRRVGPGALDHDRTGAIGIHRIRTRLGPVAYVALLAGSGGSRKIAISVKRKRADKGSRPGCRGGRQNGSGICAREGAHQGDVRASSVGRLRCGRDTQSEYGDCGDG